MLLVFTSLLPGNTITSTGGDDWASWQAHGKDKDSVVADPQFSSTDEKTFGLKASSPAIKQMGFVPIDVSKVGPQHTRNVGARFMAHAATGLDDDEHAQELLQAGLIA